MVDLYCEKTKEHLAAVKRAKADVMSSSDVEKICGVFRMLADATRMKVVLALMKGNICVYHLAEVSNSTVSGVSHQLRVLRDNNIVKVERQGRNMEYSIADEHVRKIVSMAIKHLSCGREDV